MASQQPFRFMDLLPELRCVIYEMILVQNEAVRVLSRGSREQNSALIQPLLQTNRQIREEAAPFWYSHNAFYTVSVSDTLEFSWLRYIGQSNRDLLRDFRFEIMDWTTLQPSGTFLTVLSARVAIDQLKSAMARQGMQIDPSILWVPVSPQAGWDGVHWVSSNNTKPAGCEEERMLLGRPFTDEGFVSF